MKIKSLNLTELPVKLLAALSIFLIVTTIIFATELSAATPTTKRAFHVESLWNLGGKGGWGSLCLDTANHQLYIPRTDYVMVVDTTTGKVIGQIEGLTNVRNIVLDNSGKFGYVTDVTDGTAGFVRVFDRSTFKLVTSVPTGQIPYTIVFDPSTKSVLVFNSRGHSATVIDSATNKAISTIPLGGRPSYAVSDGKGGVFVALPALGEITRIDTAAKKVTASWQLKPCTGPIGLAIDEARHQLFTACEDHNLIAVDTDTGHVTSIGEVPANSGDIDFDSKYNMIFIADSTGALTIYHRDPRGKYSRLQTVNTRPGARVMTISQQDNKAYLVTSKFGQNTNAVSEELQFRPTPILGSFSVIVVGR